MHIVWTIIKFLSWLANIKHGVKMAVSPKYRKEVRKAKEEAEETEIYGTE